MPHSGRIPKRAWVSPNVARSDATITSHDSAISSAPVKQAPLTAAITGVRTARSAEPGLPPATAAARWAAGIEPGTASAASPEAISPRSTPAENAGSVPVSTTAATSGSPSTSPARRISSSRMARRSALRLSGRCSVIVRMPSRVSTCTAPWLMNRTLSVL